MASNLRFRLMVDLKEMEAMDYRVCREDKDNTNLVQAAMEFLHAGLHGRTTAGLTKYEELEAKEFFPEYTPYPETELPNWEDVVDLANEAIDAYNSKEFGLTFEALASEKGPHCVRWIHHEGGIKIEYNWDLAMKSWLTTEAGWNRLPISKWDEGLPEDLQIIQDAGMTCTYRMTATYGWDGGEEK